MFLEYADKLYIRKLICIADAKTYNSCPIEMTISSIYRLPKELQNLSTSCSSLGVMTRWELLHHC